jgi:hypothetical protein
LVFFSAPEGQKFNDFVSAADFTPNPIKSMGGRMKNTSNSDFLDVSAFEAPRLEHGLGWLVKRLGRAPKPAPAPAVKTETEIKLQKYLDQLRDYGP